jgi:hypothetical protein
LLSSARVAIWVARYIVYRTGSARAFAMHEHKDGTRKEAGFGCTRLLLRNAGAALRVVALDAYEALAGFCAMGERDMPFCKIVALARFWRLPLGWVAPARVARLEFQFSNESR